jgi:hypothetical protein
MVIVLGLALMVVALVVMNRSYSAPEQAASGRNRYTVVETQGHNLLVTDNTTNKLYFYTIDKDVPIGSPMKLRASLDLTQVGKDEIKITPHNLENIRKREER